MNLSTKDEPNISPKEFTILREIVKGLPDLRAKASLESATESYEKVLSAHNISIRSDKTYFSALLKLSHYAGESWPEKLLGAAAKIEKLLKSGDEGPTRHRRARSMADQPINKREASNRSVLQQKLDRGGHLSKSTLLDVFESQPIQPYARQDGPPILTHETKYALVERYKLFIRTQSHRTAIRVLHNWRHFTRYMQAWRQDQWSYAVQADHGTLVQQAFEIWQDAFYNHIDAHQHRARREKGMVCRKFFRRWENRIIARREGQFLAKVRAEKQALFDALLLKNRKKTMRITLRSWRVATRKWLRLSSRALVLRDKRTQLVAWKSWFFLTCELKTAAIYNQKIVLQAFRFWVARLHHLQILQQNADEKRSEDLLLSTWDIWRANFAEHEVNREVARDTDTTRVLRHRIKLWHDNYKMTMRTKHIELRISSRLKKFCFDRWTAIRRAQEGLLHLADEARLRSLFRSWKRESKATEIATRAEFRLLRTTLSRWNLETRGRSLRHDFDFRMMKKTISDWSYTLVMLQDRLKSCEDQFLVGSNGRLLHSKLGVWRTCRSSILNQYDHADAIYHTTIKSSAFASWLERGSDCRFQNTRALKFETKQSNKKTFYSWYERMIAKQIRDREERLHNYCERRDSDLLARTFTDWRSRHEAYKEINEVAGEIAYGRQVNQQRYFFTAWIDRHLDIFEMARAALDYERSQAAALICNALHEKFNKRTALARDADEIWSYKIHEGALDLLRKWRQRYLRCLEKERQADLWADLFEKRQHRAMFRRWKALARSRGVTVHSRTYIGDTSSESLNASRTRVEWNDGTTFASPRHRTMLG
ncbi:protein of unknown function [Taphrina deformans PYCC 5710]|uniref:Sfi1 spindle body domain-containing protein n=1 Tax=Taphrina deformans (strain PYCC 5710 / ATCC 11124 / CBS 356.35 / IMI 108563 / JCM 9778 / NBRC 8474) TaxID=1097556 RepID=R4XNY3_TAPDE|nr:protein of unknown function [Taphrina deformans PYCC 5710]|eukprot:CCG84970.1 protein of unknown function [Taphrina deformans PYCC 5710]